MQELAQELLNNTDTKSLGVKWNHDPSLERNGQNRSHYDPFTDQVNIGTGSAGDSRVMMEEAIHSMTSKKLVGLRDKVLNTIIALTGLFLLQKMNHLRIYSILFRYCPSTWKT